VVINIPSFFSSLFAIFKTFMSKKTLEKVVVCPGKTLEQSVSKCPFIKEKFAVEDLPSFLGGKCKVRPSGSDSGETTARLWTSKTLKPLKPNERIIL
jgi:hypothetical protein